MIFQQDNDVMVQPDKVEIHELKPKMLTKDKGVLIHY